MDVDRKANELVLEMSLAGQPKSTLAASIAELGETRSLFNGMAGNDAPLSVVLHGSLPQALRAPQLGVDLGFEVVDDRDLILDGFDDDCLFVNRGKRHR